MTSFTLWGNVKEMADSVFKKDEPRMPTKIQTLDLPDLHEPCPRGREFVEALGECPDKSFFKLKSVQIIIDNHFSYWDSINLKYLVIPAFINLLLFWFWNNVVLPVRLRE